MTKPKPHEKPEDLMEAGTLERVPHDLAIFRHKATGNLVGYTQDGRWVDAYLRTSLRGKIPTTTLSKSAGERVAMRLRRLGRGVLSLIDSPIFEAFAQHRGLDLSRVRDLLSALGEDDPDEQALALAGQLGTERLEALLSDIIAAKADGSVDEKEMADLYLRAVGEVEG